MISSANAKLEARLTFSLSLTVFADITKTWGGKIKDASIGLTLVGSIESSLVLRISGRLRFVEARLKITLSGVLFDLLSPLAPLIGVL